jgi:phosphatidylinositol alpha-mannosyltransferase
VRLVLASDGDMRPKLEDYVKIYKLPNVEFLGFIDDETKVRLYASADVYTAPSPYGEGFGIVLLEAIAMGVPYVAGDNPGYRYASADMADELLVDPYDAIAYADKLEWLLTDESARTKFARWSAKRKNQFDYERIVDQYQAVYEQLIAERDAKEHEQT